MNETARNELLRLIQTTDDASRLNESFALCVKSLFSSKTKSPLEAIKATLPAKIAAVVEESIKEQHLDPKNTGAIKQLLDEFLGVIDTLDEVSLTLAVDPPQKTIDAVAQAIKETFGQKAVLLLGKDESILGGAIIIMHGRYLDYSLRKKLSIIFEARKAEITQLIND